MTGAGREQTRCKECPTGWAPPGHLFCCQACQVTWEHRAGRGQTLSPLTDCYSCKGPVAADGWCGCEVVGGPCAGVIVRPHVCWPTDAASTGTPDA